MTALVFERPGLFAFGNKIGLDGGCDVDGDAAVHGTILFFKGAAVNRNVVNNAVNSL